jgi:hypothetical protein
VSDANVTGMRMPPASLPAQSVRVRYVVLHHTGVVPEHYDLMVSLPGAEKLLTWRVLTAPETWGRDRPAMERLADHRMAYLTYEGPVSGGRGRVKRVAEGEGEIAALAEPGVWRVRLEGSIGCEMLAPV